MTFKIGSVLAGYRASAYTIRSGYTMLCSQSSHWGQILIESAILRYSEMSRPFQSPILEDLKKNKVHFIRPYSKYERIGTGVNIFLTFESFPASFQNSSPRYIYILNHPVGKLRISRQIFGRQLHKSF